MFSPDELKVQVLKALQAAPATLVPPDKRFVLVGGVDLTGAKLIAAVRVGNGWEIAGEASHPLSAGPLQAGVTIHGSF